MTSPAELRQLADQLDKHLPPYVILDPGTTRAAAVALRHHATLTDENERLRDLCGFLIDTPTDGEPHHWAERYAAVKAERDAAVAAAAASPPPAPTTCPTCRGDGVVLSGGDEHDCRDHGNEDGCFEACPDSWHQQSV